MPSLLGYDARTKWSRWGNLALAAIAGARAARGLFYKNPLQSMPPLRRGRYRRRAYKKKLYRRKGRKIQARKYRGKAGQFKHLLARRKRLNTNLSRNDFDSTRECLQRGFVTQNTTSPAYSTYSQSINLFPLAEAKREDYNEYKVSNVQVRIKPRIPKGALQYHAGNVAADFQYAFIPCQDATPPVTTPSWQTLKNTPGVQFVNMSNLKAKVFNLKPMLQEVRTTEQGVDQIVNVPMKWQETNTGLSLPLQWCPFRVYIPQSRGDYKGTVAGTADFEYILDIEVYATFVFRGNKSLVDIE